jgi:8-amino-3,8-dideoxy-alpha-D-manno-octulosonate transaminase
MPRELFERIIDDLARIGFRRTLSFHFYNEPLLDKRLPDLVAHARRKLPHSVMDIFTNGDYLTPAWVDSLVDAGIQVVRVSLHSATAERHVCSVLEQVDESKRRRIIVDSYWDREQTGGFLYNRIEMAESLPPAKPTLSLGTGCSLVNSLAINYQGDTALCCNDFHAANGHGNVAETSVGDLWRRSRPVRKRIYLGQFDKQICQICNVGELR